MKVIIIRLTIGKLGGFPVNPAFDAYQAGTLTAAEALLNRKIHYPLSLGRRRATKKKQGRFFRRKLTESA